MIDSKPVEIEHVLFIGRKVSTEGSDSFMGWEKYGTLEIIR